MHPQFNKLHFNPPTVLYPEISRGLGWAEGLLLKDGDAGGGQSGHSAEVDIHTAVARARTRTGSVSFPERNADPDLTLVSPALFAPAQPHQVC